MKISATDYYDYYYTQLYQRNSTNTTSSSTELDDSSDDQKNTVKSSKRKVAYTDDNASIANLNLNGRMVMNSMKMQDDDAEESQEVKTLDSDFSSIKTADIDSMSSDEVKAAFSKLKTDVEAVKASYIKAKSNSTSAATTTATTTEAATDTTSTTSTDSSTSTVASNTTSTTTDTLTEADMRSILKKVQDNLNNQPPMPPMPPQDNSASDPFSKVKEDMDSIKTLNVDSMSTDELKEVITNLKNDIGAVGNPYANKSTSSKVDLSSTSEADLKAMLKKIQEKANGAQTSSTSTSNTSASGTAAATTSTVSETEKTA